MRIVGRGWGLGSGPREDAAYGSGAGFYIAGGGVWYYGAGPSGCWEGFSGSEAELHQLGRSLRVWLWV